MCEQKKKKKKTNIDDHCTISYFNKDVNSLDEMCSNALVYFALHYNEYGLLFTSVGLMRTPLISTSVFSCEVKSML